MEILVEKKKQFQVGSRVHYRIAFVCIKSFYTHWLRELDCCTYELGTTMRNEKKNEKSRLQYIFSFMYFTHSHNILSFNAQYKEEKSIFFLMLQLRYDISDNATTTIRHVMFDIIWFYLLYVFNKNIEKYDNHNCICRKQHTKNMGFIFKV